MVIFSHKSRHGRLTALAGLAAFTGAALVPLAPASAGSLSATPTSLALAAPAATAKLTVSGKGEGQTAGQVRVLRWIQQDGAERLVPTRDVVASPPALRLDPGKELTVRLVRTTKKPVSGEECYRVMVDQLPGAEQDGLAVKFALRHSIPLCFDGAKQKQGAIGWSLRREGGKLVLTGTNSGQRRVVASDLKILGPKGAPLALGPATVLGGSSMSWPIERAPAGLKPGARFTISATINGKTVEFDGKVGGS
ncbi:molecular chaperone [Aestuariivirga sp.]|uniref:fimbrial biogenesis chaperone n=1 Tax=Aestuariivirga sp. TaxID=2650926 RepID=UPI0039189B6C